MNRRILLFILFFLSQAHTILAGDKFTINDFVITPGITDKTFSISLENEIEYAAFQFDLYLPEGLTISGYNADTRRLPNDITTLKMEPQTDGSYRFVAVEDFPKNIAGKNGGVITIKVSASNDTPNGDYHGYFKHIKLSKTNGEGNTYTEMSFPITIVAPSIVKATDCTRKYGDDNPIFQYTVEGGKIYGDKQPAIACNATKKSDVGTYEITISKGSIINDNVTYQNGTLTIAKAPLTIKAKSYTITQGSSIPNFEVEYNGFKNYENKDILDTPPTVSCQATKESPIGEYDITISNAKAKNYEITFVSGKLIIEGRKFEAGGSTTKDEDDPATYQVKPQEEGESTATVAIIDDKKVSGAFAIPETVKSNGKSFIVNEIAANAFENNTSLTDITIPKTITKIGDRAFAGCKSLQSITINIATPLHFSIASTRSAATRADGSSVFEGVDKTSCKLYVPDGSVELYKAAPVWNEFHTILPISTTSIDQVILSSNTPFDVYNLLGQKIRSGITSIKELPQGIYIINGQKIAVR